MSEEISSFEGPLVAYVKPLNAQILSAVGPFIRSGSKVRTETSEDRFQSVHEEIRGMHAL